MKFWTEPRTIRTVLGVILILASMPACLSPARKLRDQKVSASHAAVARRLFQQQRLQEALGQANRAIQIYDKNPDAYLVRGQIFFGIREYARAIEDFTTANDLRDPSGDALNWRGWAKVETGDLEGAEQDWHLALQDTKFLTPEKIYLNLALLYKKEGETAQSIENLERAVVVNPAYARGHYELGKAREAAGQSTKAIISYQAALGGMRDSADLNLRLALALESTGDGARAREHFKRVIELDPKSAEAEKARARLKQMDSASF